MQFNSVRCVCVQGLTGFYLCFFLRAPWTWCLQEVLVYQSQLTATINFHAPKIGKVCSIHSLSHYISLLLNAVNIEVLQVCSLARSCSRNSLGKFCSGQALVKAVTLRFLGSNASGLLLNAKWIRFDRFLRMAEISSQLSDGTSS